MTPVQKIARLEAVLARILARAGSRPPLGATRGEALALRQTGEPEKVTQAHSESLGATEIDPSVLAPTESRPTDEATRAGVRGASSETDIKWSSLPPAPAPAPDFIDGSANAFDGADAMEASVPVETASSVSAADAVRADDRAVSVVPLRGVESIPPSDPPAPSELEFGTEETGLAQEFEASHPSDQPPDSSRRLLGPDPEEQIARIAFGKETEQPPCHTPPPESGRMLAGSDSDLELELGTKSSFDPFEARVDDHADDDEDASSAPTSTRLVVLETRASIPSDGDVAEVIGSLPRHSPETFLQALRSSMSL